MENQLLKEYIRFKLFEAPKKSDDNSWMREPFITWREIKNVGNIQGAMCMFRKTYSSLAKDELKSTTKGSKLTGHLDEKTLDRFYYKTHKEVVIQDADKVALLFNFGDWKKTG